MPARARQVGPAIKRNGNFTGVVQSLSRQPYRWGPMVRNAVNSLEIADLSNLKKLSYKLVDFGTQNVKWYHSGNFAYKVVVLC
jgi:hypothetical protein